MLRPIPLLKKVISISIHVSDRTLSCLQYEDSFKQLYYRDLKPKIERIPKRHWETIAKPLLEAMNNSLDFILRIEEDPIRGTKSAAKTRYDMILKAQEAIKRVERPLWVWWGVSGDPADPELKAQKAKRRMNLCESFNYVLGILHDMQVKSSKYAAEDDHGVVKMVYYTYEEIEKAEFLKKLRELLIMTHGKAIRMSRITRDAEGAHLVDLVDTAWYYAVHGNKRRLDIPEERERRKKYFSIAISALRRMERPLFAVFAAGSYSNRELKEWMDLLSESVRMLSAVQQSDTRRAG